MLPAPPANGLHAALLRDAVSLGGSGLRASSVDLEVVRAVELMMAQRRPVALVVPQAGAVLVTLAAAHALAALAAGRRGGRLAAVTTRLAGRERYDRLRVEGADLRTLLPRCTGLRRHIGVAAGSPNPGGGTAALLEQAGPGCGHGSCLSVLPDAAGLDGAALTRLRGVLADLDATDLVDLQRLLNEAAGRGHFDPLSVVCVTSNPFEPALRQVRAARGQILCLDQPGLAALTGDRADVSAARPTGGAERATAPSSPSLLWPRSTLQALADGRLHVTEVADLALDRPLAGAYAALTALSRAPATARREAEADLPWAWTLLAALGSLPVSVGRHDRHRSPGPWSAPPLHASVERAEALAAVRSERGWSAFAQAVRAAAIALAGESKVSAVLRAAVGQQSRDSGSTLVVVPNRSTAAALTAALAESTVDLDLGRVHVSGIRDLQAGRAPAEGVTLTVLCGPLLRRHGGLLATPGPGVCALLAAGPHQSLRAADQAVSARATARALREQAQRDRLSTLATGSAPDVPAVEVHLVDGRGRVQLTSVEAEYGRWVPTARQLLAERVVASTDGTVDLTEEQLVWTPFGAGVLKHLGDDDRRGAEPDVTATGNGTGAVSALPVAVLPLDGGAPMLLPLEPLALVTRRDPAGVGHVAARALQPGDLVAVIDGLGRQSLFEIATQRLAELPGWQLPVALAALWRDSAARAGCGSESYEQLRKRLGTNVQASTVGTWVRGEVVGPDDPDDVHRLAAATGDQALLARATAVWTALQAIRRAHRALGRWLSSQMAQAAEQGLMDDALRGRAGVGTADRDLGIDVADLLDGVKVLRVLAVGPAQAFPTPQVGRLQSLPASAVG